MSFLFKRRAKRPIRKILIANRGEIAVRIIRTARDLGLASVAVYSDQDMHSLACDLADEALALGGSAPADTYLSIEAILTAAKKSGADAIHPGYGFLSENADFAAAVRKAGLVWIGPSANAIGSLGDKISARAIATKTGVPVIPGAPLPTRPDAARDRLLDFARRSGYPVLVKRADAGGGRGITRFDSEDDVLGHFDILLGSAPLSGCFVEKMVTRARHVETQCARDAHGGFEVVTTRDCSVQRRNQKLVEEAPAPHLPPAVERALESHSRALFEAVDYIGVGTCEFLVGEDSTVHFLEVNPRLQVEHTVSEEVAGLDLVAEQIRIAAGLPLSPPGPARGHSFEVRITSEDPAARLMPATGRISRISWPGGPGVRVDAFIRPGDAISPDYDSLIGKLIVSGPTRADALARLRRALGEFSLEGLPTSVPLIEKIITHPDFCGPDSPAARPPLPGSADSPAERWPKGESPFAVHTKWLEESRILDELADSGPSPARPARGARQGAKPEDMESFTIELDGRRTTLRLPREFFELASRSGATPERPARTQHLRKRGGRREERGTADSGPALRAPIQATVVRVLVEVGQSVAAGDLVLVLESMKMEKPILAHRGGRIADIRVAAGDSVTAGDLLVLVEAEEETR